MRVSATRVRWLMLGGVILLAAVVAGFFGLARYRAGRIWQRILARNGVNLRRETNGITWSQSSKGRTIFTVHASKATPLGANRWALHDAVLILYGREPGRDDRIYGDEFEYDQDAGIARAKGEVHMDLQTPEPGGKPPAAGVHPELGFSKNDAQAVDPRIIHVRTSGLVYTRRLGLAATKEATEFRFAGITCTAKGAEFDSERNLIRMLAEVKLSGQMSAEAFTLTAAHAELDRVANTAELATPVWTSGERGARADHALLHLDKHGTLQAAEAQGGFQAHAGSQSVMAPQLDMVFGPQNRPRHAHLFQGVSLANKTPGSAAQGQAHSLDLAWDDAGRLTQSDAEGQVEYVAETSAADGTLQRRTVHAEKALGDYVPDSLKRNVLHQVHLAGQARVVSTETLKASPSAKSFSIEGRDLVTDFVSTRDGHAILNAVEGMGSTVLEQHAPDGAHQRSAGDLLHMTFEAPGGQSRQQEVSSATQTGHVTLESWPAPKPGAAATPERTTADAEKAVYLASTQELRLSAQPAQRVSLHQATGELQAAEIVLHQATGDIDATGRVTASSSSSGGAAITHVLASQAKLVKATGTSEFLGKDGRPAQFWQGGSQVQAERLLLDAHHLVARSDDPHGRIQALFAAVPAKNASVAATGPPKETKNELGREGGAGVTEGLVPATERDVVLVSAERMDYDEIHHDAVFAGEVLLKNVLGQASADRGVAFLKPTPAGQAAARMNAGEPSGLGADLGGNLDRLVMLGDVHLKQPGRMGTGQQLIYTASTNSFALTGSPANPPRILAEQGTSVTGATLLFGGADSTIVVAGSSTDTKAGGPARVHTETDLKK